ncbi:hypothetical protein OC844_007672, partial [Tilletia horrida]
LLRMLLVMPRTTSILAYALLSIFILGSAVQAFNQDWDNECVNAAEALCSSLATMRHSPSWDSALYHCLAPHWIDMPNDGNVSALFDLGWLARLLFPTDDRLPWTLGGHPTVRRAQHQLSLL